MDEMSVVWNGSFKDVYLCIPPVKITGFAETATVTPTLSKTMRRIVASVIPTDPALALTNAELIARSGASYSVVAQALYRLRQQGVLRWNVLEARGSGQRPRAYWRVPAPVTKASS